MIKSWPDPNSLLHRSTLVLFVYDSQSMINSMRSVFWQKVVGRRIRRGASWRCNIRSTEDKKLMQQCLERSGLANFFFLLSRLSSKGAIDDNVLWSRLSMTVRCFHGGNTLHRKCSSSPSSLRGMIPSIRPIPSNTDSRRLGAWFLSYTCNQVSLMPSLYLSSASISTSIFSNPVTKSPFCCLPCHTHTQIISMSRGWAFLKLLSSTTTGIVFLGSN